ncbi:MAG: OprO/OprP family phosphate-selective porin [Proteobacteria bacterium]|nr:OprO/OprP family phosphate-selective porin [Pseudomonadota bacterium]
MVFRAIRPSNIALIAAFSLAVISATAGVASAQNEDLDADEQGLANEVSEGQADVVATDNQATGDAAGPSADVSATAAAPEAKKKSKKLVFETDDGKHKMAVKSRIQGRYEYTGKQDADDLSRFVLQRIRLGLAGHAFSKNINYAFQVDFAKGAETLKVYYLDLVLRKGIRLRVGQFKRPTSRQLLTSSSRQEFVDRAVTVGAFKGRIDIGLMVHNNYSKSPDFEWAVGVFNGNRADTGSISVNTDDMGQVTGVSGESNLVDKFGPVVVARVGINRNGLKGYSQADLEGGPLRFGVGAAVLADFDIDDTDADKDGAALVRGFLDFVVKVNGFSTTGALFLATQQKEGETAFTEQEYADTGFHLQAGYMVTKQHQVVARYAQVIADNEANDQQEITAGYSFYPFKHSFKWQTDVGLKTKGDQDLGDQVLVRSQLQLSF